MLVLAPGLSLYLQKLDFCRRSTLPYLHLPYGPPRNIPGIFHPALPAPTCAYKLYSPVPRL